MRMGLIAMVVAGTLAMRAEIGVTVDSVVQDAQTRAVTVTYTLSGAPAIVTASLAPEDGAAPRAVRSLAGAVNRQIDADGTYTFTWHPDHDLGAAVFGAKPVATVTAWPLSSPPDYMVVDLATVGNGIRYYTSPDFFPWDDGAANIHCKVDKMVFRRIPAAGVTWMMGTPPDEGDRVTDGSETQHAVRLTRDYWIGIYEVTQGQYHRVVNASPSLFTSGLFHARPVEQIRYINLRGTEPDYDWPRTGDVVAPMSFMGLLRTRVGGSILFDLPTEAEWEFACRAGTTTRFNNVGGGTSYADALRVAWCSVNAGGETHEVGLLEANAYGLYDMLGNVREWCRDYWTLNRVPADGSVSENPGGPEEPTEIWVNASDKTEWGKRSLRGMGWYWNQAYCRSGRRDDRMGAGDTRNSVGFRVWAPIPAGEGAAVSATAKADTAWASGRAEARPTADDLVVESMHEGVATVAELDFRPLRGLLLTIF